MKYGLKKKWDFLIDEELQYSKRLHGLFFETDNDEILFLFKSDNYLHAIIAVSLSHEGKCTGVQLLRGPFPAPIGRRWGVLRTDNGWKILCNERTTILLTSDGILSAGQADPALFYELKKPYHFEDDPFIFDSYRIEHKGNWGFVCKHIETNTVLWNITLQGYLYADIVRRGERIWICTAEHGGFVYCIHLATGELIYKVRTGGTFNIVFADDYFLCYQRGNKGKLLLVDRETGTILQEQPLFQTSVDCVCPLTQLEDGTVLTLSFKEVRKNVFKAVITCFEWRESESIKEEES